MVPCTLVIGIGFGGLRNHGYFSSSELVKVSVKAETRGFHSTWVPENYYTNDSFTILSAIGALTKKIRLATSIVNPYTHHPAVVALTSCTVNQLSSGRFILGIGVSPKILIEGQMGIRVVPPLEILRESVRLIRELMNGSVARFRGKYFHTNGIKLENATAKIPIYVAAIGPKMLQLAGEIGDGVVLTEICSVDYVKFARSQIAIGAERAGKRVDDVDIACRILTSVEPRKLKLHKTVIGSFFFKMEHAELVAQGYTVDPRSMTLIKKAGLRGNFSKAGEYVPNEVAAGCSIIGNPKDAKTRLEEYRNAGVTLPVLCPPANQADKVLRVFAE